MNELVDVLKLIERHLENISVSLRMMEIQGRKDTHFYIGQECRQLVRLYDFDGMDQSYDSDSSNS
jgi:hypothetical protein